MEGRAGAGCDRVRAQGGRCWFCGVAAVCGARPPGRWRRTRWLCQAHADAVFGPDDPPWLRQDARTQREIVEDWLRGVTILAHPHGRSMEEMLTEISEINQVQVTQVRIVSPLLPGEALSLKETVRSNSELRSREMMVHAVVTQILVGWLAEASGQDRSAVIQRLSLTVDGWLAAAGQ